MGNHPSMFNYMHYGLD